MSKLKVELLAEKAPGIDDEIGLNERKPSKVQYSLIDKTLKIYLGLKKELTVDKVREIVSSADWKNISETEVELNVGELPADLVEAAYEIIILKSFIFDKYKTDAALRQVQVKKIVFKPKKPTGFEVDLREVILSAVKFCRDIVSSNASSINPGQMQSFAEEIAHDNKALQIKVINASEAKKLGLNCLLAVGAESLINSTSDYHPRLVVMEYTAPKYNAASKKKNHIALVGKGITFDTGGLCLKPNNYMLDMKSDMAGAASVLSVFKAIGGLKNYLPNDIKITGVMALSENAFGGASYKPGDVLTTMNGKTIEVIDTDAEGRLVLADALCYASTLKPNKIIDIATLTGSMVSTLGEIAAGAMGNKKDFFEEVNKAFSLEGEKLWLMPLYPEYKKILDSSIADIKHCNTRPDGLCAGIFLKEFVAEGIDWLHLDIAGVGFIDDDGLWAYKGATGFSVKGLIRYLLQN